MDASTISMLFFIIPLLLKFGVPELSFTKSIASGGGSGGSGGSGRSRSSC